MSPYGQRPKNLKFQEGLNFLSYVPSPTNLEDKRQPAQFSLFLMITPWYHFVMASLTGFARVRVAWTLATARIVNVRADLFVLQVWFWSLSSIGFSRAWTLFADRIDCTESVTTGKPRQTYFYTKIHGLRRWGVWLLRTQILATARVD